MKKIFLSLPMKNRSDEAIKATIEGMKRILKAYYPDEELVFYDNFEAGYKIPQELIDGAAHPQFLYLSRALFKIAACEYIAYIDTEVIWRINENYNGCKLEMVAADSYGLKSIKISDETGEILLPDLYEKAEEEAKKATKCYGETVKKA